MTSTVRFSKDDTRESALRKVAAWYDSVANEKVTDFALAIAKTDVPDEQKIAALEEARLMADEGRAPFLAQVADVLNEAWAGRDCGRCADMLATNRNECERRH